MNCDFAGKEKKDLENIIANHRRVGQTNSEYFIAALSALDARKHKGFDLQKTLNFLIEAAGRREYVSYKDVATVNGITWSKAHRPISPHLDAVCEYAVSKRLPLLTAIVVNIEGVNDGSMKPESRAGFIMTAKRLGMSFDNEEAFVKSEQQKVFDYFSGAKSI